MHNKPIVNCQTLDDSIAALCHIYGLEKEKILTELDNLNINELYKDAICSEALHVYLCEKNEITPRETDEVVWFHFSKSLNPKSYYTHGLLPTNLALSILRDDCFRLIKKKFHKRKWDIIWQDALEALDDNDKCKFDANHPDFGPNGMLIKDVGLYPSGGTGNFIKRPEIIEGILRAIDKKYSTKSLEKFENKGKPCVVTFVAKKDRKIKYIANTILHYVYCKRKESELCSGCTENYFAKNTVINKKNILMVETVSFQNGKAIFHEVDH